MSAFLELTNLSLEIPVFNVNRSFRASMLNKFTGGNIKQDGTRNQVSIKALENINFRLEHGDRLGLIGHNGAGKTTLLRILAGIYKPLSGSYTQDGTIASLFNVSLGMDLDESGVNNIYIVGMHLGMSKKEINAKKKEIIEFSELGDYIYLPVKIYSAGMQARLSFSIATAIQPDILLMDEGIGAGDASFIEKAQKRLTDFYSKVKILIVASHSDDLIRNLCNKAMLLEQGRQIKFGSVEDVLHTYHQSTAKE